MTSTAPPPAAGTDFDPGRLRQFLAEEFPELTGELSIDRVGGGQSNPTYFVAVDGTEWVLRKRPVGDLPSAAHDVSREFRIMSALVGTDVPVPTPVLHRDDPSVLGTPFYLMQRLHGRIFHDAALSAVPREERRAFYRTHAHVLAALHRVDWQGVGLGDLARPGSFVTRQIDRWARQWGDERAGDVRRVHEWLHSNKPATERTALIHGDFKFNNVVYAADGPEMIGVLDWELAGIGDPLLDLGHFWAMTWATTPAEYGGALGLDAEALGLPSEEEFLADYYEVAGDAAPLLPFHRALAVFRNSGIFIGIAQRAAAGTAASANAAEQGATAHAFLDRTLAIIDG